MKTIFTLDEIIVSIIERRCLVCGVDLDLDLGRAWKLPMCNSHRNKFLMDDSARI